MDKPKPVRPTKTPRTFKLFARTIRLLAKLASKLNLSETAALELAVVRMAQAEGIADGEGE